MYDYLFDDMFCVPVWEGPLWLEMEVDDISALIIEVDGGHVWQ